MMASSVDSDSWTTLTSAVPTMIQNMIFSPSGRWAVDLIRKCPGRDGPSANIFDMLTMSYKRYDTNQLHYLVRVVDLYWISESEFIIVDELKDARVKIYCHVDHEKGIIVPFMGSPTRVQGDNPADHQQGANPLYYQGKRYYLLNSGTNLMMVPWNSFYEDTNIQILVITMPRLYSGDRSTYETAFCQGSKIFMPLKRHIPNEDGKCVSHIYKVHCMVVLDVNALIFDNRCAYVPENLHALKVQYFKPMNGTEIKSPKRPLKFRQVGEHVLAFTTDQRPVHPNAPLEDKERFIYTINLRELTIHFSTVVSGPLYFPTIYRDQLYIIRNDYIVNRKKRTSFWKNTFIIKQLHRKKVSSLEQLARSAVIRNSIPVDPVFNSIIFPKIHCCMPYFECICEGIMKTTNDDKYNVRQNIKNALENIQELNK